MINVLLTLMCALVVAIALQRNLFAAVVLWSMVSFLMATLFVALDAVDVAMTEAAVGAGISTVLLLGALYLCRGDEARTFERSWAPLLVSLAAGGAVIFGTLGLPVLDDAKAPIHVHVAPRYLERSVAETGVPNVVTAVLASYRGFDTLGETIVVFTGGVGVLALLRRRRPAGMREGQ